MRRRYCENCNKEVTLDDRGAYYVDADGERDCPTPQGFVPVHVGVLEEPLFEVEVRFERKLFQVRYESVEALEEILEEYGDSALDWLETKGKEVGWSDWIIEDITEVKE